MAKIKTLLLSGENNHDWRRSTPFCKELLEGAGLFDVTVTEDPSGALAGADALKDVDLLFDDYNGPDWSPQARANFERAVAGGTGLVVLHAANNAFAGWAEFEKMAGLLWRDGAGHGEFHEFEVKIADREHPITRGMEDFLIWDELYHRLTNPQEVNAQVLATAYSSPDRGGSGDQEPMMAVLEYGRGRVFHQILGHVWAGDPNGEYKGASMIALENPSFKQSLLRGCQWAATGEVTLP